MSPVPDSAELLAAARKPRLDPEAESAIVWPSAIVLSGWADATFGQVNVRPPAVTEPPGARPAAARPCAENVVPSPSKPSNPGAGLVSLSSVIPVLSNVAARFGAGTLTCAVLMSVWVCPGPGWVRPAAGPGRRSGPKPALLKVALASRLARPGLSPDEGAVTVKVADADAPGATLPSDTLPDGATVQAADGGASDTEAPPSGPAPGLASVAFTVNVPSASA